MPPPRPLPILLHQKKGQRESINSYKDSLNHSRLAIHRLNSYFENDLATQAGNLEPPNYDT